VEIISSFLSPRIEKETNPETEQPGSFGSSFAGYAARCSKSMKYRYSSTKRPDPAVAYPEERAIFEGLISCPPRR
jgi:hypothetical protein